MLPLLRKVPRIAESRFAAWLLDRWYGSRPIALFKPLAGLFAWITARRRAAFQTGQKQVKRLPVPVLVVGNIVVGGAGKTPAVLAVVKALKELGYTPAILSRGYGANLNHPRLVTVHSSANEVGDEPILLFRHSEVPVAVGVDRYSAGDLLLNIHSDINCIVCDDGLQHYALHRDIELLVMARDIGVGNGALLPAGPLREPMTRLDQVDALIFHGASSHAPTESKVISHTVNSATPQFELELSMGAPIPFQTWKAMLEDKLADQETAFHAGPLHDWSVWKASPVHAVAGIGHPQRFFDGLRHHGLQVIPHTFPDHHRFKSHEFAFPEPYPIMMTEKDAVKCLHLNCDRHWVIPLHAQLEPQAMAWLRIQMEKVNGSQTA
jgi:tetraacyldisaccharide 4'-kinase